MALKEYCICKIASFLKIGPNVSSSFGFDVLIFSDCLHFCMEKCQPCSNYQDTSLIQGLKMLHSLKIVHIDIKPENIMFSPVYGKNVFIDFGCSTVIEEQAGYKSHTTFKGTLSYCSNQMKILYQSKQQGYVDLYYNDLHALQKVSRQNSENNLSF